MCVCVCVCICVQDVFLIGIGEKFCYQLYFLMQHVTTFVLPESIFFNRYFNKHTVFSFLSTRGMKQQRSFVYENVLSGQISREARTHMGDDYTLH